MSYNSPPDFALLELTRPRTPTEDRKLAEACMRVLVDYRKAAVVAQPSQGQTKSARQAFLHLGGDPLRSTPSLKDYDHVRYGPFLGVSDEGSAAGAIRDAAWTSPKAQALSDQNIRTALAVGVAVDAERLGGIGEVNVGPVEYADIWLQCVDRVLITTNVATRVNLRVFRREPVIKVTSSDSDAIARVKREIAAAFKPFVETPDLKPRPLTVFIDFPTYGGLSKPKKRSVLKALVRFVASGGAVGGGKAPAGQQLGLATWVKLGLAGRDQATDAIDLAASAGVRVVMLDGTKRKAADQAISLAGLLDYFAPGLVGQILREAKRKGVRVRTANLPDTDTIARSTWVGLNTARCHGANLGKYGCFPLTIAETDQLVQQIQEWLPNWSAAPVLFVDQGVLSDDGFDVERDLMRGLKRWLETVASHRVRVVLIDTIDKASGRRLLRNSAGDKAGYLGPQQIAIVERIAHRLGVKVLWAGSLNLRDAFEMGRLGVFGLYVTTTAATTIPVPGSYARDPSLASLKEPSLEAVRRVKILLEAGFLSARLERDDIGLAAEKFLSAVEQKRTGAFPRFPEELAERCRSAWSLHWASQASPRAPCLTK